MKLFVDQFGGTLPNLSPSPRHHCRHVAHSRRSPSKKYQNNFHPPSPYSSCSTSTFHNNNLHKELSNIFTSSAWLDKCRIHLQKQLHHHNHPRTFNNNYKHFRFEHAFMVTITPDQSNLLDFSNLNIVDTTTTNDFQALLVDDLSLIQHGSSSITQHLLGESNFLPNNLTSTLQHSSVPFTF